MTRSTLLHLRIPFSYFLLPVFLFTLSVSINYSLVNLLLVGISMHFFLYPASNGYNSYFDQDEGSIGGLENPPKVVNELYGYSLLFDFIALLIGVFVNWQFVVMMIIYGLISKAYSHPMVRLKKMPYLGWFIVGLFQGYFTFLMIFIGINGYSWDEISSLTIQFPALLSSLILWGSYPMTQIYQHDEDKKRGDITISIKLGIKGTFHFTAVAFFFATLCYLLYFYEYYSISHCIAYILCLSPVLIFFGYWYIISLKSIIAVNYSNTKWLNIISSTMLNIFFLILILGLIS